MNKTADSTQKVVSFPLLALLWLHLFWCLSPSWEPGGYYSYGWLVAPLTFFFGWRRIGLLRDRNVQPRHPPGWPLATLLILFLVLMIPLRMVEIGDPTWRPPLWIHALMVAGLSHFAIAWRFGWKASAFFIPVTIFGLSAVPYPWQIEQTLIRTLTGGVIKMAGELFNLFGRPVNVLGEQLESMGTVVEVTDGCSGIRSFQNLIMASLFFGEFYRLKWFPRVLLIVIGIAAAVVMNTWRAMTLARIRFDQGSDAFDAAHDNVGYLAFGLSALLLLAAARYFSESSTRGRKVIRRQAQSA